MSECFVRDIRVQLHGRMRVCVRALCGFGVRLIAMYTTAGWHCSTVEVLSVLGLLSCDSVSGR